VCSTRDGELNARMVQSGMALASNNAWSLGIKIHPPRGVAAWQTSSRNVGHPSGTQRRCRRPGIG
jgi:hypothetical protein